MAIPTQVDLVLDVVRAADPEAAEAARAKLASHAPAGPQTAGFSVTEAPGVVAPDRSPALPEAFTRFEAMVLQTFFQSMLPQDTESVYGEGLAGEIWQSMLAEQLGNAVAERGGIGIADRILRNRYMADGEQAPRPERDAQEVLSVALVQDIQRKLAHSLSEDRSAAADAAH